MDHPCSCAGHHRDEGELGAEYTLYQKIYKDGVECLNERVEGSGVTVFKTWEDRLNRDKVCFYYKVDIHIHYALVHNNNREFHCCSSWRATMTTSYSSIYRKKNNLQIRKHKIYININGIL